MVSQPGKRKTRTRRLAGSNHLYVTLDPDLIKDVKIHALDKSVTTSSIVELALRAYLKLAKKSE